MIRRSQARKDQSNDKPKSSRQKQKTISPQREFLNLKRKYDDLKIHSEEKKGEAVRNKKRIQNKFLIKHPPGRKLDIDDKKRIMHCYWTLKLHNPTSEWNETSIQELTAKLNSCSVATVQKSFKNGGEYQNKRTGNKKTLIIPNKFKEIFEREIRTALKKGLD